jgi:4-hydroxybenzoyl-CoA thioesterase
MTKTVSYDVKVSFGDCDPTGMVMAPNYSRWMDASSHHFFVQCGLPPFRELLRTRGIAGHPLLEIHTKYFQPAVDGDCLVIHTSIIEWREKVFRHKHLVTRGQDILCEGTETRAFVIRPPENPDSIKSIPIPEDIKALCS